MKLSAHFTLQELIRSQFALRNGIDNMPPAVMIGELIKLCRYVLEPLRAIMAAPIIVTSGYRCPELNAAIGGSQTSQHMRGQAADFTVPAYSNLYVVQQLARSAIPFDQVIYEFGESGWIHASRSDSPRLQILRADRNGGTVSYTMFDPFHADI